MSPLQFFAPIAYGAVAAAVAIGAPDLVQALGFPPSLLTSVLLGGNIFLFGMLAQEMITRRKADKALSDRIQRVQDVLIRQRSDMRSMQETVRAQGEAGPESAAELETVVAEMRMLKTLVGQLSTKSAAKARPAAPAVSRPAAAPSRPLTAHDDDEYEDQPAPAYDDDRELTDEELILDSVREALNEDRVGLSLQPIVQLPSRRLSMYQCMAAIRTQEGTEIPAETYLPIAEQAGLLATINNMLLVRSVQFVRRMRRQRSQVGYVCEIVSETLRDRDFFADFTAFMRENTDLAGHLHFQITQHDAYRMEARTDQELTALGKLGFRFVLDKTTNL
ncbi:EAL domain-containing protein, partial [Elstera litoralis]|uniref:EAL domain-containing protein n=1 Tax=Elstera litoralis TaxID=552518 RepID=UPI000698C4B7